MSFIVIGSCDKDLQLFEQLTTPIQVSINNASMTWGAMEHREH